MNRRAGEHLWLRLLEALAGLALLGLFSVGLGVNRDSIQELEATQIAQSALAERRAAPLASNAGFLLPVLDTTKAIDRSNPVFLTEGGKPCVSGQDAKFAMISGITPSAEGDVTQVRLCVFWPAKVALERAQGKVEMFTTIALQP